MAMLAAERSRKCYATNEAYRERKKAQSIAWVKDHPILARLRQRRYRLVVSLAEKWLAE